MPCNQASSRGMMSVHWLSELPSSFAGQPRTARSMQSSVSSVQSEGSVAAAVSNAQPGEYIVIELAG
jgi:hypothetical protein